MGDNIMTLAQAAALVRDGDVVAVGGNLSARQPIALIHELIRQGRRGLATVGGAHGLDIDLMCAGGVVAAVQNSFVGFEFDFGLAPNYRRACESGAISVRDSDCNFILQQLRAAQYGIPFMPMPPVRGTDILQLHPEYRTLKCPYTGEELTIVPALKPDVALVHGLKADPLGNVYLPKPYFADVLFVTAAEKAVVTVEELITPEAMRELGATIPYYEVAAVAVAPFGSHPTSCYPAYAYDRRHIARYVQLAQQGEAAFRRDYLDTYVYGVASQAEYLQRVGDAAHFARLTGWQDSQAAWMEVFADA